MSRFLTLCAAAFALSGAAAFAAPAPEDAKKSAKRIDVVICLDVSNSMDGLIQSAKLKLWDIVNDLAKAKPTPDLRVALYSYGNDGYDAKIGWVRKELDLSTDLDALYQKLNALTTNGGTEYVARVCRDALDQQKWSEDKDTLRIIFVCGNEPASQDKQVTLKSVAELAGKKSVLINPIFCGPSEHRDATDWKEFAALANGRFASIDQDRGTVAIATPMDKELAELSGKLNTTYCAYGDQPVREQKVLAQAAQDSNAAKASPTAAAARAGIKAGKLYRNESWDLVDRLKSDPKFDVKKLKKEELTEELQKMTPEQREKHVKDLLAKREEIQKKIETLSHKRAEYLREQVKKNPSRADKAFDTAIRACLREQAAPKGITIPE